MKKKVRTNFWSAVEWRSLTRLTPRDGPLRSNYPGWRRRRACLCIPELNTTGFFRRQARSSCPSDLEVATGSGESVILHLRSLPQIDWTCLLQYRSLKEDNIGYPRSKTSGVRGDIHIYFHWNQFVAIARAGISFIICKTHKRVKGHFHGSLKVY